MSNTTAEPAFNRYMLRRTLVPWKFQETIDEAAAFCAENAVQEVIWKIDTEEGSHGLPTLDLIRSYVPWLIKSREQLAKVGVTMSINPYVTQGMRDAGWDLREVYPDFEWLTDITGIQCKAQACPMGPAWREWLFSAYEIYASTGPNILWIEDDFRVHRHRPVMTACFCERHIQTFSKKVGRTFTRESLVAEILKPGEPSPLRAQWMEHVGGNMAEVAELLAARVYAKYPNVQLGLMCNSPSMQSTEHRDWDRIVRGLAGHHPRVVLRPTMCEYTASSPMVLYVARQHVSGTLKSVHMPVQACTEIENARYSLYAKSIRLTRAQMLLSGACGCPSMTFNLFDHLGTPLNEEPEFGRMLREARPLVDQIVQAFGPGGIERGVGMLHDEKGAHFIRLNPGQAFHDIAQGMECWGDISQAVGMSLTWGSSPVIAVTGQKLRGMASRLDEFFSGGVLLDLSALETLISMGRQDLVGVNLRGTFPRRERKTSMEAMTDPEFGGAKERYTSVDHGGLMVRIGELEPPAGARTISWLCNPDREPVLPGFVLCENKRGGRVAICPFDMNGEMHTWFLNQHRRRQIVSIVTWLFRGKLPLETGGVYPLAIRKDYPDRVMAFVMNLALDDWANVELALDLDRQVKGIQQLDARGEWKALPAAEFVQQKDRLKISSPLPLACADAAIFKIT